MEVTAANDKEDTKMSLRMGGGHKRAATSKTEGDREIVKVREGERRASQDTSGEEENRKWEDRFHLTGQVVQLAE